MQNYECEVCGAQVKWSPEKNALYCEYCGTIADASKYNDDTVNATEGSAGELDKEYTTYAQDLPDGCVAYKCSECGAEVVMTKTTMQTECVYCGQAINITEKTAGKFRADYIIPYSISEETAKKNVKAYYRKNPLLPFTFTKQCKIENFKRLFVPYYLYSAGVSSDGLVQGETQNTYTSGDTKYTEHKLYEVSMKLSADFEKVPVDGSKTLENKMMDGLEPFDYEKIKNFNPAYMAGYFAEQPDDDMNKMTEHAKDRIKLAMNTELVDHMGKGYVNKTVKQNTMAYSKINQKLTLLPVYYMHVKYKDVNYPIVVNGQSGKVSSVLLPGSYPKLFAIMGGAFAIVYAACCILGI